MPGFFDQEPTKQGFPGANNTVVREDDQKRMLKIPKRKKSFPADWESFVEKTPYYCGNETAKYKTELCMGNRVWQHKSGGQILSEQLKKWNRAWKIDLYYWRESA